MHPDYLSIGIWKFQGILSIWFRSYLGQDLLPCVSGDPEEMFRSFWNLKDSIVCCAWKVCQHSSLFLVSHLNDVEKFHFYFLQMKLDQKLNCWWLQPLPEFIFANQAALDMLETNANALRGLSLEQMFHDGCRKTDYSQPPPFIQRRYSINSWRIS